MNGQSEALGEFWQYELVFHRLSDFLGLSKQIREDSRIASKVNFIKKILVKKAGSDDPLDVLAEADKWTRQSGLSVRGELLLNSLYQSLRLKSDIENREAQAIGTNSESDARIQERLSELDQELTKTTARDDGFAEEVHKLTPEGRIDTALQLNTFVNQHS